MLPSLAELTVPCPGVSGIDVAQKADSEMTPNHQRDVDNDPQRIPVETRLHCLKEAMVAFERALAEAGIVGLDYFGRFEAIEIALDDAHDTIDAQLPPLREN